MQLPGKTTNPSLVSKPLRIAVVGVGVAGSYLISRLSDSHQVVGFDKFSEKNFDAVCAWGTSRGGIEPYAKKAGICFEDYVLHDGNEMLVEAGGEVMGIKLKGLCTFDKLSFIRDLADGSEVRLGYQVPREAQMGEFDLVVDSTGLHRPLLPQIKEDYLIPCVQFKAKFREPPYDDFYIRPFPRLTGYFWYFPLGNGYAHVGAGDINRGYDRDLSEFLRKHGAEVVGKNGRPIRITPPSMCEPFYAGNVVGVGESIGAVYPMLGEGIIPGLQCAELLVQNLDNVEAYRKKVLAEFAIYESVFSWIRAKIKGSFSTSRMLGNLLKTFLHMKSHERRYGLQVKLREMLRVVRV